MFELNFELDDLLDTYPCEHTVTLNSQREMQDFSIADFDRKLRVLQVRTLIDIAESLALLADDKRAEILDRTRVS